MLYNDPFLALPFKAASITAASIPAAVQHVKNMWHGGAGPQPAVAGLPPASPIAAPHPSGGSVAGTVSGGVTRAINTHGVDAQTARIEQGLKNPGTMHAKATGLEGAKIIANPLHSAVAGLGAGRGALIGAGMGLAADLVSDDKDSSGVGKVLGGAALGAGIGHYAGGAARKSLNMAAGHHIDRLTALKAQRAHIEQYAPHMLPQMDAEIGRTQNLVASNMVGDPAGTKRLNAHLHTDPATAGVDVPAATGEQFNPPAKA